MQHNMKLIDQNKIAARQQEKQDLHVMLYVLSLDTLHAQIRM